jgi:hypothetical protein
MIVVRGITYKYIFCFYSLTYFDCPKKYNLVQEGVFLYAELYNAHKLLVINNGT